MAELSKMRPMSRLRCDLCPDSSQGVSEGTRTPDRLDHNQELYQLSYAHRVARECTGETARRSAAFGGAAASPASATTRPLAIDLISVQPLLPGRFVPVPFGHEHLRKI